MIPLAPYKLPDGRVVLCDDTACKGARVIDFTLKGGTIVLAVRVNMNENQQRAMFNALIKFYQSVGYTLSEAAVTARTTMMGFGVYVLPKRMYD